jgi:DNA-binding transcriptional LysR family regulator
VRVRGKLSSGDGAVLHEWALSGEGISWEALWDISDDLASGRLVHLMPDYQSSPMELYAIFAPGKPVPPRIRLFVDHIVQAFGRFGPSASNITGAQPTPMVVHSG